MQLKQVQKKIELNKYLLILITIILFSQCSKKEINNIPENEKIDTILNQWHKDAKESNFEPFFNRISKDGFYIGTDASENWTKKEFISFAKPYFDKQKTWDFKTIKRTVFLSKNKKTAWFNELLDTWMGTCRGSGILEKENSEWKIKQYVLSVTIPNSEIKKVIKITKSKSN